MAPADFINKSFLKNGSDAWRGMLLGHVGNPRTERSLTRFSGHQL